MTLAAAAATVAAIGILVAGIAASPTDAADHLDAPGLTPPGGNLMADVADLFVFPPPGKPHLVVLAATFNPAAGVFGPTGFDPKVSYLFHVSNDGDAEADIQYRVRFGRPMDNGRQSYSVFSRGRRVATGVTGRSTRFDVGEGRAFTGLADDPFFFDLDAFLASGGRSFCDGQATDFFAGLNVNAIVIQVPIADLGGGAIGVWVSTRGAATDDSTGQIDRIGFPAINTVFIPKRLKNEYNEGTPAADRDEYFRFVRRGFVAGGNSVETATALAAVLLPDMLPYDPSAPAGFLNGRRLEDDVIDTELLLLSAGALVDGDCVDANDVAFRDTFPYLAKAQR